MPDSAEISALIRQVRETFEAYVKLNKRIPPEMQMTVEKITILESLRTRSSPT